MAGNSTGFWDIVTNIPTALTAAQAELGEMDPSSLGNSGWRVIKAMALLQNVADDLAL
jgi:hypothetical protein